ncbi:MAG: polysaccharide deacetylase family protein [Bacteroidetes bacterium]|nr:polysaccharide deacetylase family protein [Bacteroidota bacterium]
MPILLEIYKKFNVKSTFYFTGYMAEHFPDVVSMIIKDGHEVASHGYSHEVHEAFDVLSYKDQVEHLSKSKKLLEDICGYKVISFRAPALRVNSDTPKALAETGFVIDSSVASQRFDMFLSFGGLKKLKWLTAPRLPYHTQPDNLFKKGNGPIVEVPLTALMFPYVGTTMRIFPFITKMQHTILNAENKINHKPIVFDVHPNEFINEESESRTIERRSKNFFSYLLADLVRGKLKVKNLGKAAIPLYEKEIEFYQNRGYQFVTVKDYCKAQGLIPN